MNKDLEAVLEVIDAELEAKAERVAGFFREEGNDPATTYEALVLSLVRMDPAELLDLAFAGVVRAAKVKLAADAATADADV